MQQTDAPAAISAVAAQAQVNRALAALDAAIAARRPHLVTLHRAGWTYRKIAAHLGTSATAVFRAVHREVS